MPKVTEQGPGTAGLATPISVEGVFDAPGVICRLVQRNGPYLTMASYLPGAAVRGGGATGLGAAGPATPGSGAARHRGTGRRTAPAPPLIAGNSRRSGTPARCQRGTSARILPDEFEANAESTKDPGRSLSMTGGGQ
jgi:hypothetical protein